jgi:hypothetical protein
MEPSGSSRVVSSLASNGSISKLHFKIHINGVHTNVVNVAIRTSTYDVAAFSCKYSWFQIEVIPLITLNRASNQLMRTIPVDHAQRNESSRVDVVSKFLIAVVMPVF